MQRNPGIQLSATTQLGLRSSGGSVRDPPAAPAAAVHAAVSSCRAGQPALTPAGGSMYIYIYYMHGGDPKPIAIAAARSRWLRAEPGHQDHSSRGTGLLARTYRPRQPPRRAEPDTRALGRQLKVDCPGSRGRPARKDPGCLSLRMRAPPATFRARPVGGPACNSPNVTPLSRCLQPHPHRARRACVY